MKNTDLPRQETNAAKPAELTTPAVPVLLSCSSTAVNRNTVLRNRPAHNWKAAGRSGVRNHRTTPAGPRATARSSRAPAGAPFPPRLPTSPLPSSGRSPHPAAPEPGRSAPPSPLPERRGRSAAPIFIGRLFTSRGSAGQSSGSSFCATLQAKQTPPAEVSKIALG